MLQLLQLLQPELQLLLLGFVLLAALLDPLVAESDQISGVLLDAGADPIREFFQGPGVVLVGGAKVIDAHRRVLGELEGLLIVVSIVTHGL